jgi:cystathionine gamma-synthase
VDCTIVPFGDYGILERAIKKNTRFIFSESPTNPYLNIFDLVKIKKIAQKHKILTLIDSTFATPLNQRPLEFGMDLVLQSCTKYLAGHNDILAGAVLGSTKLVEPIRNMHKSMGGLIDPHCCFLLLRGLKTFPLRVERQNQNALAIAEYLAAHPRIQKIYYPFLSSHPHYDIAVTQMKGGGGVVTFEIKGNLNTAKRFLDELKLCYIGPSLGGCETLITHPALVSYYAYSRKHRYELGVTDTLFRLAVGIEAVEDIIADLDQALKKSC